MANDVLRPEKACFGQIFFSTNYDIGDRAEIDVFSKSILPEKTTYYVNETRTPPILEVERLADDLILLTTAYSYYVCYPGHSIDEKYNFVTIGKAPVVGKKIEIVAYNKGTRYAGIYSTNLVPEEVNDRFAKYNMYIFKAGGKVYLCLKR